MDRRFQPFQPDQDGLIRCRHESWAIAGIQRRSPFTRVLSEDKGNRHAANPKKATQTQHTQVTYTSNRNGQLTSGNSMLAIFKPRYRPPSLCAKCTEDG